MDSSAFALLFCVLVLLLIGISHQVNAVQRCNLDAAETHALRMVRAGEDKSRARSGKQPATAPGQIYELQIVFHVIMNSAGTEGYVPLDSLLQNMENANSVFSGKANSRNSGKESNLRVFLTGVTYTNNTEWYNQCGDYDVASKMKFATALSSATLVNVWTCYSSNLLGWVYYLPYELTQSSVWNGLHLNHLSFPFSKTHPAYQPIEDYADGDTFTHELGHYLGLLHTFGDGVDGCNRGDDVDDTPPEATPAFGKSCQMKPPRNTCPDTPGVDPVWNIMDYSDDSCAEEFTPGQVDVMRYSIEQYKTALISPEPMRCVTDGSRGPASKLTMCKSECFTVENAPDGRPAPTTGWCRTDVLGNWGTCCCGPKCYSAKKVVPVPDTLSCGRMQEREELFKPEVDPKTCVIANIGGGPQKQVTLGSCSDSEYVRWAFNFDGTIVSIGTGWCLTVLDYDSRPNRMRGKRVGLEPCQVSNPIQTWSVLPSKKTRFGAALYLKAAPDYCIDTSQGTMQMKECDTDAGETQNWLRSNKPNCASLKSKSSCLGSTQVLGCSCRWLKNTCMN